MEEAGGSQDHLPADALDNLKLALAMRATYETYVDELVADASAITKWTRSEDAQQNVLDLYESVEEIFEFPKMVGLALDKLSYMPTERREAFLLKAKAARVEMLKEDTEARRNKTTSQYTDRFDLSRAVWLQMTQPERSGTAQVGPQVGFGPPQSVPYVYGATGFAQSPVQQQNLYKGMRGVLFCRGHPNA